MAEEKTNQRGAKETSEKKRKRKQPTLADAVEAVLGLDEDVAVAAAEAAVLGEAPRLRQLAARVRFAQHQVHVLARLQRRSGDVQHQNARRVHLATAATTNYSSFPFFSLIQFLFSPIPRAFTSFDSFLQKFPTPFVSPINMNWD